MHIIDKIFNKSNSKEVLLSCTDARDFKAVPCDKCQ